MAFTSFSSRARRMGEVKPNASPQILSMNVFLTVLPKNGPDRKSLK